MTGPREHISHCRVLLLWGLFVIAVLVLSGLAPYDRVTWLLEVAPVLIALPFLLATYRSFPLTSLLYFLIGVHALVLIFGDTVKAAEAFDRHMPPEVPRIVLGPPAMAARGERAEAERRRARSAADMSAT